MNIAVAPISERQGRLGDEDQAVAEEEADRLQVDRRPGHELAGLLAVEEAELEALEVRVDAVAQVELDAERDLAGHEPPGDGEREADERDGGDGDGDALERRPCRRCRSGRRAVPVSHGIATVATIAPDASTNDQMTPAR